MNNCVGGEQASPPYTGPEAPGLLQGPQGSRAKYSTVVYVHKSRACAQDRSPDVDSSAPPWTCARLAQGRNNKNRGRAAARSLLSAFCAQLSLSLCLVTRPHRLLGDGPCQLPNAPQGPFLDLLLDRSLTAHPRRSLLLSPSPGLSPSLSRSLSRQHPNPFIQPRPPLCSPALRRPSCPLSTPAMAQS